MSIPRTYRRAAAVTVLVIVTLFALLWFSLHAAAEIVREDHAVEWLQVALFAAATVAALTARRPPAALDVLLAVLFVVFIDLEVDLDRRLVGRPVIDKRYLLDPTNPVLSRLLVVLFVLALGVGLLVYAWRRRAELAADARALIRTDWGRLLVAGLALLATVELFEKSLGTVPGLPRFFLEELLELIATIYCFMAMIEHALDDRR